MNKIFKVIWNPATGSYSVASETAKSRGKKSGRSKLLISALVAGGLLSSFGVHAGNVAGTGVDTSTDYISEAWIAIGIGSQASTYSNGASSIALGSETKAVASGATAIGYKSEASTMALAIGQIAIASGDRSMAIGNSASATKQYAMAFGGVAQAKGKASIAWGREAKVAEDADYATAVGYQAKANAVDSLALGRNSLASAANAIAMGADTEAAENATAIGNNAKAKGKNSIAIGTKSIANVDETIVLGIANSAGLQNQALKQGGIAIGRASKSDGINAIVLGNESSAAGDNSLSLGTASNAGIEDAIALGHNATVTGKNSVALGAGSEAKETDVISVGNSTLKRKLINVKSGTIAANSTDAINGSQIYDISSSVATHLGGGAGVEQDTGKVTSPNYVLKNGTASTVGQALTILNDNTVQWDALNGVYTAAHGSEATSKITNVKDGTVSATSKDAVNGSQLNTVKTDVTTLGDTVNGINTTVGDHTTSISALNADVDDLEKDALLWNNSAFSAKHGVNGTDSKITDVADGTISATSKDAVNGSQLNTVKTDVTTLGDTVNGINTTVGDHTTSISALNADVDDLEKDALLWNNSAFSAKHGVNGTDSKITDVADGTISATSKDAVNGSQLNTVKTDVTTLGNTVNGINTTVGDHTTSISALNTDVDNLEKDALLWNGTAFSAKHDVNGTDTNSVITNVANGAVTSQSTDAINGSQIHSLADSFADYFGGNAAISDSGVLTGPTYTIGGTDYTNVGDALAAINTSFSASMGDALLWDSTAKKFSAIHGGNSSIITGVADGVISSASTDAVNGSQLYDTNKYITDALGGDAEVKADGTYIAPTYTIANTDYNNVGDALEAIDTTLDDALLWDATANGGNGAFSAGRGANNTASIITNVADGAISATSSDAINGSQLYDTNKYIADTLGGNAEVNADGTMTAPTYSIASEDYHSVGEALDALDDNALLWDETAGAYSASHNGKASVITNVADGLIEAGSTDAVNGSQLNAANLLIEQNSQIINQLAGNTDTTYIENNGAGINYVRTNDSGLTFNDASASGVGATAVGYNSVAKGDASVAIGENSFSEINSSIALGSDSVSSRVIVKGSRNTSVTENGVVIGYDTTDGELLGALSIGDDGKYRQIINVADGSEAHDAVTVRQLQNAIGAVATTPTKYFHANSTEEDSLAVGTDSLAMGAKTVVNGNAGIGIGLNTLVLADAINGIAIGSNARANHADSIAMGNGSQTTRGAQTGYTAYNMDAPQNSVGEFSVGSEDGQRQITNVAAGSADTDAVNVGQLKVTDERVAQNTQSITNLNTQVTNLDTRVTNIENGIGDIVTTGSTKYFKTNTTGVDANAQGTDSVAIGSGSIAAADNSVALGTGSVANEENTISVGSSTNQRRITNVAAGKNATDAVNVAQLKSSEAGSVRYDTKSDGSVDYSSITLGGGSGGTTRISNVSAGVNNNDAVNYAQLKQSVQETKQYTDQRMVEMDNKLSKTESKLSGGIASAMAMTGLPQAYTPGASMASIGGGTYNGESAVALGVSMVSANGRWVYKLQGSTNSQGEYSAALGAGIQW
ncbi:adhesin [Escherichia coli]|nr:adhesin [Escherichia coli]EHD2967182.1 adhesin [Escherichia coli]EKJ3307667.1 YadA-like family protein [Escherichia coli]QML58732.1 YadA-like family protein [Escherichia coli]